MSPTQSPNCEQSIVEEQTYVDGLFQHLDAEVEAAQLRLAHVQRAVDPDNPDADALVLRETEYHALNAKLDTLNVAEVGLVFGRIDVHEAAADIENPVPGRAGLERRYIGRIGIDDRQDSYRTLLLDWRAPLARPFYLATTANPEGVELRRNIRMRGRRVVAIHDEQLSGKSSNTLTGSNVGSEAALHQALNEPRTGYMQSIVETIQREQDAIIRDNTRRVMVVQGGPGTGKTAVALHRVAYLLYTWREQLAKTGVLIIGPNTMFLDYISRVLPELGETGVVLTTIENLVPGFHPTASDTDHAREIKGSLEMCTILKRAVQAYQVVPTTAYEIALDGLTLKATPAMIKAARTRARRSRKPHNSAQPIFAEHLAAQLAKALAEQIGQDPLGGTNLLSQADIDQLQDDLSDEAHFLQLVEQCFPPLTPEIVLRDLLEDRNRIAAAAYDYDDYTQEALYREPGSEFTISDTALIDELALLLGIADPEEERRQQENAWRHQVAEAEEALDILASSESTDNDDDQFEAEILSASDVIDAETLASRQAQRDTRTTAQRAQSDLHWAYGHIIVDEAQELSPMEWRMVFRRCPSRWMTLVGDVAQTSSPAGSDDWATTLTPFVQNRYVQHELTVNYRTPQEIMGYADLILANIDQNATSPESIRTTGKDINYYPAGTDPKTVAAAAEQGLVTIIDANNVETMKGLEFDHVVVVEPSDIINASPQGWQNLYVAVTRATQTLSIIGDPVV